MNGNGDGDSGETSQKNGCERTEYEELCVILQLIQCDKIVSAPTFSGSDSV